MKKKKIIIALVILIVLFCPVPSQIHLDGGTPSYTALTYKVVKWNRFIDVNNRYHKTSVYWFPDNFKTIDELWIIEN